MNKQRFFYCDVCSKKCKGVRGLGIHKASHKAPIKNTLFNEEVEEWVGSSNMRVYTLFGVIVVAFVFVGWVLGIAGEIVDYMVSLN